MTARRNRWRLWLAGLLVLAVVAIAGPAVAVTDDTGSQPQQAEPTTVTDCTVIDRAGRYQLAADIDTDGTCIEITASDVYFDGAGHSINDIDPNSGGNGIEVNANATGRVSNVTVTDVRLTNWVWNDFGSTGMALRMERVDGATVTDLNVTGGNHGIRLRNVTESTIARNDVSQVNNHGVYVDRNSDGNTLSENTITQADRRGLLLQSASNNTVDDNLIAGSGNENVRLASGSNHNTFTDNEIYQSSYPDGCVAVATTATHLVFRNNSVYGCGGYAISFSQAGSDSLIEDNTVNSSTNHGIRLNRLDNVTVQNNTASFNDGHGINVQRSTNVTVVDNYARENVRFGINLYDMRETVVRNNTVASNENGGLRLVSGSSNNTLVDNTVLNFARAEVASFPTGIRLRTADDNRFRNNTVENAYIGIEVNESANGNTLVDTRVNNTATALWTVVTTNSEDTTVESLDIGDSSATNTTLSFRAYNVTLAPNTTAPANPDATAIDRYAAVGSIGDGSFLNLSMHYESGDVTAVNESLLAIWTYDAGWTELDASAVDTRATTVSVNVTNIADVHASNGSTVGVFATDDGDSHAIERPDTPTPTPTTLVTDTPTDEMETTENAPETSGPAADQSATPTSGGSGPGFDIVAGVLAFVACALLLRRER